MLTDERHNPAAEHRKAGAVKRSEVTSHAREMIRNRLENGYPFEDGETAETVALEMVEQSNPFSGARQADIFAGVYSALKAEGCPLPRK